MSQNRQPVVWVYRFLCISPKRHCHSSGHNLNVHCTASISKNLVNLTHRTCNMQNNALLHHSVDFKLDTHFIGRKNHAFPKPRL